MAWGFGCVREIVADGGLQVANAAEGAAPDTPVGEQAKEPLDLVQPTGAGRSEMHVVAGTACKPALYFGHLVSAVVIHDQMNVEWLGNGRIDSLQETEELLMPVPGGGRNR